MVAPEMVAPIIAPLALTERTSAVVAPLFPLASLIVPSGEDGTDRVKLLVAEKIDRMSAFVQQEAERYGFDYFELDGDFTGGIERAYG